MIVTVGGVAAGERAFFRSVSSLSYAVLRLCLDQLRSASILSFFPALKPLLAGAHAFLFPPWPSTMIPLTFPLQLPDKAPPAQYVVQRRSLGQNAASHPRPSSILKIISSLLPPVPSPFPLQASNSMLGSSSPV